MALFESAAKLKELQADFSAQGVILAAALAEVETLKAELAKGAELFAAQDKTASEKIAELAAKITGAESALNSEKAAHEATKTSVDALASTKAQTILAQAGRAPVEGATEEATNAFEKLQKMPAGKDRLKFAVENWNRIRKSN